MYLSLLNCIISDQAYQKGLWFLAPLLVVSFFQAICVVIRMQSEVSRMDAGKRVMVRAYAFVSCVFIVAFLSLVVCFWFLGLVAIACR